MADGNCVTLSKLKGTVDYIKSVMSGTGDYDNDDDLAVDDRTVKQKICSTFHKRSSELESDVTVTAYVIDPQFILQSRSVPPSVMNAFWTVSLNVLRVSDDDEWGET